MKVRTAKRRVRWMVTVRGPGFGPVCYARKRADWPASTSDLKGVAWFTQYEQERRSRCEARLYDEAYTRACELDSPNSIGFDALQERIFEQLLDQS